MKEIYATFRSPVFHLSLIAALACIIYSNTFSVPFHFDDKLNIVDNAFIKDIKNFWPPAAARWFGYFTFALNYRFNGLDTTGYHAVNLAIHILNSFLVYWLVLLIFKTAFFTSPVRNFEGSEQSRGITTALLAALLFAAHPVQTQAITYIVQRFASLATLLYLLSLTAYGQARLLSFKGANRPGNRMNVIAQSILYVVSFLSAVLAMKTKEISFTLPVVIILYEFSFFGGAKQPSLRDLHRRKILYFLPFLLTSLIIPLTLIRSATGWKNLFSVFTATNEISRHDYLLTQFRVLVTYLRLLFFPLNQTADYDYTVYRSFFDAAVLFSVLLLASLCGLAVFLSLRSRSTFQTGRVIAFGIFWFFITLSVESSIIPIADVIYEHRLYLPSAGIFIAAAAAGVSGAHMAQKRHRLAFSALIAAGGLIIIVFSTSTFLRNRVWSSETGLWQDVIEKHPANVRAHSMLGILYQRNRLLNEAIEEYVKAVTLKPSYAEAHVNLGSAYVERGMLDQGMKEFMTALHLRSLDDIDTANLYINIGYCYQKQGLPDRAIEFYNYALPIIPDDANVYFFLGKAYDMKGFRKSAAEYFSRAHQLNPDRF